MSTFTFLSLCIQAYLVQNVFSQCLGGAGLGGIIGYAPAACGLGANYGLDFARPNLGYGLVGIGTAYGGGGGVLGGGAVYGDDGIGDVAVTGELPVTGNTLVAGNVPILGVVEFEGNLPASGAVTIAGSCGCGCRGPYMY